MGEILERRERQKGDAQNLYKNSIQISCWPGNRTRAGKTPKKPKWKQNMERNYVFSKERKNLDFEASQVYCLLK